MSAKIIAFFNTKGGVGKTTLVYHLAWMYQDLGLRVVAADLDPQANLTATFLDEERLELFSLNEGKIDTIFDCVKPLLTGIGDIDNPHLEYIQENHLSEDLTSLSFSTELGKLALFPGDIMLSSFEDELSAQWTNCLGGGGQKRALQVTSAFWRILQETAVNHKANVILMDLSPSLGAINRAALIAADYLVIPLALEDYASLVGLRSLGYILQSWKNDWKYILSKNHTTNLSLPSGDIQPIGYVVWQMPMRLDRPAKVYNRAIFEIQNTYREVILNQRSEHQISIENDPNCLGLIKSYHSLMTMAQEVHKPMFHLKPADGAIGAHTKAVKNVYEDFKKLAHKIAEQTQLEI
ncbi:ParA family protein [Nostoc sp. CHAB 5715]|uniref:ParA family protein n=1 Tax=Nostoc sp. CHAB 5715 TaxID=2780400 RepID=UPI001E3AA8AA|nr:AAA family ATPase [Nostoc sp. CHAB 5715]MCC5622962.1 AAA family ATPase [Nostoc sp. CHAB 5715]